MEEQNTRISDVEPEMNQDTMSCSSEAGATNVSCLLKTQTASSEGKMFDEISSGHERSGNGLASPDRPCDSQVEIDISFEERIVKEILISGKQIGRLVEFRQHARDATGHDNLTLAWFEATFPRFPVRLFSIGRASLPTPRASDLMLRFESTAVFTQFTDLAAGESIDLRERSAAMLFSCGKSGIHALSNHWRMPSGAVPAQQSLREHLCKISATAEECLSRFGRQSREFSEFLKRLGESGQAKCVRRFLAQGEGPGSLRSRGGACVAAAVGDPPIVYVFEPLSSLLSSFGSTLIEDGLRRNSKLTKQEIINEE